MAGVEVLIAGLAAGGYTLLSYGMYKLSSKEVSEYLASGNVITFDVPGDIPAEISKEEQIAIQKYDPFNYNVDEVFEELKSIEFLNINTTKSIAIPTPFGGQNYTVQWGEVTFTALDLLHVTTIVGTIASSWFLSPFYLILLPLPLYNAIRYGTGVKVSTIAAGVSWILLNPVTFFKTFASGFASAASGLGGAAASFAKEGIHVAGEVAVETFSLLRTVIGVLIIAAGGIAGIVLSFSESNRGQNRSD